MKPHQETACAATKANWNGTAHSVSAGCWSLTPKTAESAYMDNYFTQWQQSPFFRVEDWQNSWNEGQREPRRKLASIINENCETFLNVGCGIANNVDYYTAEYFGVDVTHKFVKEAHRKGVQVVNASGCNLPFQDETFDGVACENVLMHIPPDLWRIFLKEMIRVARKMVCMLENRWDWSANAKTQYRIPEVYGSKWFYLNIYSAEDVKKIFRDANMTGYAIVSKDADWQLTVYQKTR